MWRSYSWSPTLTEPQSRRRAGDEAGFRREYGLGRLPAIGARRSRRLDLKRGLADSRGASFPGVDGGGR